MISNRANEYHIGTNTSNRSNRVLETSIGTQRIRSILSSLIRSIFAPTMTENKYSTVIDRHGGTNNNRLFQQKNYSVGEC